MPYAQVATVALGQGATFMNVWTFFTENSGYADAQDVADYVGQVYDSLAAQRHSSIIDTKIIFRPLNQGTLAGVDVVPDSWPTAGTLSGDLLPLMNAPMVTFTVPTERPNRVRKYLYGWTEASWASTAWTSGGMTALGNWALAMRAAGVASDGQFYPVAGAQDPETGVWTFNGPLTAHAVATYSRTQRRRRPGVGI